MYYYVWFNSKINLFFLSLNSKTDSLLSLNKVLSQCKCKALQVQCLLECIINSLSRSSQKGWGGSRMCYQSLSFRFWIRLACLISLQPLSSTMVNLNTHSRYKYKQQFKAVKEKMICMNIQTTIL